MKFSELKLCMAIARAGLGGGDRPSHAERLEAASRVMREYLYLFDDSCFPYSIDDIENWRLNFRKQKDTQMKINVAIEHGVKCFWSGRDKGPCCEEAECGHLVPKSQGGELSVQNCVIECRAHNNQRKAMLIEEYIRSELRT